MATIRRPKRVTSRVQPEVKSEWLPSNHSSTHEKYVATRIITAEVWFMALETSKTQTGNATLKQPVKPAP